MDHGAISEFVSSSLLIKVLPALFVCIFAFILRRKDEDNVTLPFIAGTALLIARDFIGFFFPLESIYLIADILYLSLFLFSFMVSSKKSAWAIGVVFVNTLFLLFYGANIIFQFMPGININAYQTILFVNVIIFVGFCLTSLKNPDSVIDLFLTKTWPILTVGFTISILASGLLGYLHPIVQYLVFPLTQFMPFIALFWFMFIYENKLIQEQERLENTIDTVYGYIERSGDAFKTGVDLNQLLDYVVKAVSDDVRADSGIIFLVDEFEDLINARSMYGKYPPPFKLPDDLPRKAARIETYVKHINFKLGESIFGEIAKTGKYVFVEDAATDPRVIVNGEEDFLTYHSLIAVPLMVSGRIIGVLSVVRKAKDDAFTETEFERTRLLADFGSLVINTLFSFIEASEKQDIEREAAIAQDIQKTLVPKKMPDIDNASFGFFTLPARGVCGDYFDIIRPRKDKLVMVVSDVAGKGIQASLVMVMIRSIVHLITNTDKDLSTILSWINRGITGKIDMDHFATLTMVQVDLLTGAASYANAAHQSIMIWRTATASIETLEQKSVPIGVERNTVYLQKDFKLENNDIVIIYTDGIIEAMNDQGKQYGRKSLSNMITKHNQLTAKDLANKIKSDLADFVGEARQHDDRSLLVMKMKL